MMPDEDIRVYAESLDIVAGEVVEYLQAQGFLVKKEVDSCGGTIVIAENAAASIRGLLATCVPLVGARFRQIAENETEFRLKLRSTPQFRKLLYAILGGMFLMLELSYWLMVLLPERKGLSAFIGCAFAAMLQIFTVVAWMRLMQRLSTGSGSFCQGLYIALGQKLNVPERVVQNGFQSPHLYRMLILSILGFIVLIAPLWPTLLEHSAVTIVGGLIIVTLVSCTSAMIIRHRKSDLKSVSGYWVVNFASAVCLGFYALVPIPLFIVFVLAMEGAKTNEQHGLAAYAFICTVLYIVTVVLWVGSAIIMWLRCLLLIAHSIFVVKGKDKMPILDQPRSKTGSIFLIVMWLISASIVYFSIYITLSVIEVCFAEGNPFFPFIKAAEVMMLLTQLVTTYSLHFLGLKAWGKPLAKFFLLAYYGPILLWFVFLIKRNLCGVVSYFSKRLTRYRSKVNEKVAPICFVAEISAFGKVEPPVVVIRSSDTIDAHIEIPAVPGFRSLLVLTDGALKTLSFDQMSALLAHEIGHLKQRHLMGFAILNFLSRWTFLGEGFLAGWMRESIHLEKEADAFAISWLDHNGVGRERLIEVLTVLEKKRISAALGKFKRTAALGIEEYAWVTTDLEVAISKYPQSTWLEKAETLKRIVVAFYFSGWQQSYRHLPYQHRIEFISKFPIRKDFHRYAKCND